jgi:hypothetical protein
MNDFEEWWNTEHFGFDHPDTKDGIKKLLDSHYAQGFKAAQDKYMPELDKQANELFIYEGRIKELESQLELFMRIADCWMKSYDEIKAKYEPDVLVISRE